MSIWYFRYDNKPYYFGVTKGGVATRAHLTLEAAANELNELNREMDNATEDARDVPAQNAFVMDDLELNGHTLQHEMVPYIQNCEVILAYTPEAVGYFAFSPSEMTISNRTATKAEAIRIAANRAPGLR